MNKPGLNIQLPFALWHSSVDGLKQADASPCNAVTAKLAFPMIVCMLLLQPFEQETAAWARDCQVEDMGGRHESPSVAAFQATQVEASRAEKLHQDHQLTGKVNNSGCLNCLLLCVSETSTRMPSGHICAWQAGILSISTNLFAALLGEVHLHVDPW